MNREQADQALARLQAEEDEISAALLEHGHHPGYLPLAGGPDARSLAFPPDCRVRTFPLTRDEARIAWTSTTLQDGNGQ